MTTQNELKYKKTELKNGCQLAYIDEGAGEQVILFVHGLANYGLGWKQNIEQLSKHYRCIAIDLPGSGYSSKENYPYSMSFFADSISEFIVKLKLSNVCLCGHSMGGQIAITTALKYPALISKLILCAPAGFEEFSEWEKPMYKASLMLFDMFSSQENSMAKSLQNSFYLFPVEARKMIDELVTILKTYPVKDYRAMMEGCIHGMLYETVFHDLHSIKQPTLVLFGDKDTLIPNKILHQLTTRQVAEAGVSKMPNAELRILSQCGHFLQWEKAREVNNYIDSFLKG
jgi:pimeloyl-ACP methyl ester carboxylesterase